MYLIGLFSRGASGGGCRGVALIMVAALAAALAGKATAAAYIVTGLAPPTSIQSHAEAINASGQVAGYYLSFSNGPPTTTAFRTNANGVISGTGLLGSAQALAINDSGQVTGVTAQASHAFRTTANGTIDASSDLGTLPGDTSSYANGINASGQTVGYSAGHAFRTTANGVITPASDLGTFGGSTSIASGINTSGQAAGWAYGPGNQFVHAFRTTASGSIDASSDLGTLGGGQDSWAHEINASGQVVGSSTYPDGRQHAFRTTPGGVIDATTDLGTLGGGVSVAYGINSLGQAVGSSYLVGDAVSHAFFMDATGGMLDLNDLIPSDSGWTLETAYGINDAGQIVGDGSGGAFLLTPTPEPSGLAILTVACVAAISRRARRGCRNTSPNSLTLR